MFTIRSRWDKENIIYERADCTTAKAALTKAVAEGFNLHGADLREADMREANMRGADMREADLRGADLREADLRGADLRGANMCDAKLREADMREANMRGANMRGADLRGADMCEADMCGADMCGADLREADLRGADMCGANMCGAKLRGANMDSIAIARLSIVPECGAFEGWKKCRNDVVVRVEIPADARRSNSTSRKCRAERVITREIIGADVGVSQHDISTTYRLNEVTECNAWNADRWVECGGGIHFFLTRAEAEAY